MGDLWVRESFVNASEGYRFGDGDWYECYQDSTAKLFRDCQREYGRCVSKMYRDTDAAPVVVGWVFQGWQRYEDADTRCPNGCKEYPARPREGWAHYCPVTGRTTRASDLTYLREVWVEVSDEEPQRIPTHYVGMRSPWEESVPA